MPEETDFPAYPAADVGVGDFKSSIGFTPSTWPVNTTLKLCSVPWDADYRDVVYFATKAAQDAYFNTLPSAGGVTLGAATYCKPNEPVTVNLPYFKAYTANYLIVSNPAQPVSNEAATIPTLYYFVTGVSMLAPNTTRLTLQLDVWQTYQLGLTMGRCFVERGHVAWHAYANATMETAAKKRRYLTAPEGLDLGNAYIEIAKERHDIGGDAATNARWWVVIVSTVDLTADFGTVNNPKLKTAGGVATDGLPQGCDVYCMTTDAFQDFMALMKDYPWISSQILSITLMPASAITTPASGDVTIGIHADPQGDGIPAHKFYQQHASISSTLSNTLNVDSFLTTVNGTTAAWRAHPKARTYPFSFIKMNNWIGEPLLLQPELFASNAVSFVRIETTLPPFQKIMIFPMNYGSATIGNISGVERTRPAGTNMTQSVPRGETLENALIWDDFPQISIVNDSYQQYLASNANSLRYQRSAAQWGLEKSNANANTSYDNANRSLDAAAANQAAAYRQQAQLSKYSMGNLVQNQMMQVYNTMPKDLKKGLNGLTQANVGRIVETTVNAANGSMANELGNLQFQNTQAAQQGNIDANYALQKWAAKGDYQQAIASINASVRDARILPPTQSGTMSGGFFANLMGWGLPSWFITGHTVMTDQQDRIAKYWQRYGYSVAEYMNIGRNFNLMSVMTYWKCADTTITALDADEGVRAAIRGIFEKGVSVWGSAADIANYSNMMDNTPSSGTPLY